MQFEMSRLEPGQRFVVRPPKGYIWVHEAVEPNVVRESGVTATLPCSASPRHLPGETPVGTGFCVREAKPQTIPMIYPTPQTCQYIDTEVAWLSDPQHIVEYVSALFLNPAGEVVGDYHHTDHQPRSCTFDIPAIIREARKVSAAACWVGHNHPRADSWDEQRGRHWAGAIEPSQEDRVLTRDFIAALREARLAYIDHTVCGPNAIPFSFREAQHPVLRYR